MSLVARTRRVDANVDLLDAAGGDRPLLFERGRVGLAGRGEAWRLPWPAGDPGGAARAVAAALAEVDTEDPVGLPGCGAVAFGTLPFAPGAAADLVVPRVVVGRSEDGARWLTTIAEPEDPLHEAGDPLRAVAEGSTSIRRAAGGNTGSGEAGEAAVRAAPAGGSPTSGGGVEDRGRQPRRFSVEAMRLPEDWCGLVEQATKVLAAGRAGGTAPGGGAGSQGPLSKVVLAREVLVTADAAWPVRAVLERLRAAYPGCHLISIDGLVGASPELLVSRSGDVVRSHPMAGTAPRGGDPTTDQKLAASLLASTKDREEHQITIDMVQDTLLGSCSYVDYEAEPSVVPVANVQHLATLVEGRLSRPVPSVLELVAALHPTPAVAGWPRDAAVEWILAHEGLDRGRYAGTAGWVDGRGNGAWAVAVRCAELDGAEARICAGNGIVAGSDPETELAETRAKLQALLAALVRP